MFLFHIEYQVKTGETFICKLVGKDREVVTREIVSLAGGITILNLYYVTEVHWISGSIRRKIVENSSNKEVDEKKIGRPKKYN